MWHVDYSSRFNFKFSQCDFLEETTALDVPLTRHTNEKETDQTTDDLTKCFNDMNIYEQRLSVFCGLWEDYPYHYYRMEFRIEMGQLVGYSNIDGRKAFASYDGDLINLIIVHRNESDRPLDHYRGRLGWSKKYIRWEKEDASRESGWRPTRRWIKIE